MSPIDPFAPDTPALQRRDWIAGLEKGLTLLQAFDEQHPRLTASQAGQRCGLSRTVARRLLLTLAHLGFVATDGKLYWLTPRVLRLGHGYLQSSRLARAVQPFLQRITSATGEPAYLAVLDGDEVTTIARNGPQAALNTGYVLGARVPARLTATGQVLLAAQAPQALDDWLATTDLTPRTPFTRPERRACARRWPASANRAGRCRSSNWRRASAGWPCRCWTCRAPWWGRWASRR
jgi:IclR family pca regulon transcriptional regulator